MLVATTDRNAPDEYTSRRVGTVSKLTTMMLRGSWSPLSLGCNFVEYSVIDQVSSSQLERSTFFSDLRHPFLARHNGARLNFPK